MQFRPFVYDAMNRQVLVAIEPMTAQDAALTDREPLWQTSWTSEYLADENYEKYAARVGDELIALAAYEILPTALVVHKLSTVFDDGQLHAGKTAMQSVVETADGNDIQMHVSTGDALSSDQTEIIGDIEQGIVLDVSLTANGTEIHSFNGKVTVSVPFTWTQQGVLQAWYLADDGTKEPVEVAYRDGNAVLTLKHFSTYAIVVKANDPDSGIVSMGENEVTVQKQADAVYYAAALYAEDGRFLAYAASEAAEDEETVTLKWANADWSKAAKVKVFFLDADRKPVAEAVTALIKGKSQKN